MEMNGLMTTTTASPSLTCQQRTPPDSCCCSPTNYPPSENSQYNHSDKRELASLPLRQLTAASLLHSNATPAVAPPAPPVLHQPPAATTAAPDPCACHILDIPSGDDDDDDDEEEVRDDIACSYEHAAAAAVASSAYDDDDDDRHGHVAYNRCLLNLANFLQHRIPVSWLLRRACIARAARWCRRGWVLLQLLSLICQIVAIMVLLSQDLFRRQCAASTPASPPHHDFAPWAFMMSSPLRFWAFLYALACLVSMPPLLRKLSHPLPLVCSTVSSSAQYAGEQSKKNEDQKLPKFESCLDFFFAVWFVMGVVWVFGGSSSTSITTSSFFITTTTSSSSSSSLQVGTCSPTLYSLCAVILLVCACRYALPLIACFTSCYCSLRPTSSRINAIMRETARPGYVTEAPCRSTIKEGGITQQQIDARLPILKFFKTNVQPNTHAIATRAPLALLMRYLSGVFNAVPASCESTKPSKHIQNTSMRPKDATVGSCCVICLRSYKENEEIRVLPCSHYFHVHCVDRWLKLNASCPLCKFSL